mmetsp:Transcript_4377/g.12247  ORF Transcript_4377/g.12247 Transcript_4377/m.12247 type:complete len:123 (-) Transcript_4377:288-656(-)
MCPQAAAGKAYKARAKADAARADVAMRSAEASATELRAVKAELERMRRVVAEATVKAVGSHAAGPESTTGLHPVSASFGTPHQLSASSHAPIRVVLGVPRARVHLMAVSPTSVRLSLDMTSC